MSGSRLLGARLAMRWTAAYTATLPEDVGAARTAEVRADVHDQVVDGLARGLSARSVSRAVGSRAVRGVLSDVAWRLETEWALDRLHSMLRSGTVLTALFAPLLLAVLVWDASRDAVPLLRPVHGPASAVVRALAALIVAYGSVAGVRWLSSRIRRERDATLKARLPRRSLVPREVVFFCFALAALGRYAPPPLDQVGVVGWAAFGGGLGLNVAGATVGGLHRTLRLRLTVRKLSS